MSDFLSNLVARSIGTLGAIRPRLPSLYEPSRRDSDSPGWGRGAGLKAIDNTAHTESRSTQLQSPSGGVLLPAEGMPEARSTNQTERPHTSPPGLLTSPARVEGPPGSLNSLRIPWSQSSASASNLTSVLHPARAERIARAASVEPGGAAPTENSPLGSARDIPESVLPLDRSQLINRNALDPARRPFEVMSELLGRNSRPGGPKAGGIEFSGAPGAQPAPAATRLVRPPLAPSPGVGNNSRTMLHSSPSEPAIRVTIGRVEVRAILPEPSPRRTPPARSRPAVSLDEYLTQRNRGQR